MHWRTFFKLNAAGALGELLRPLAGLKHMPVEFDDRGLAIIGNNVKAISFYDDARTLRAQIFLDGNNALNVSTTVISGSTSSSGAPAGIESAAFLVLASDTTLLGERVLALGSGLVGADGGPGGGYSLDVSTTVVRTTRQVVSGPGLTGGGDLSADRTLAVGAGTGISVAADTVGIDLTASLTWTGAHVFQNTLTTRTILPEATDTYNIGSATVWYSQQFVSQINAAIFAENVIQIMGGEMIIAKQSGKLPAVSSGATTIDFGQAMTPNDFVLVKAHDTGGTPKTEYIKVGTLVSGTNYNVTRDQAGAHGTDPAWADGTPYVVLGNTGNGWLDLAGGATPRYSVFSQGATYNAQTEVARLGDLNGNWGYAAAAFGLAIGEYASNKPNLTIDSTNGLRLRTYTTTVMQFDTSGNADISSKLRMPGASSAIAIGATPPTASNAGTGIWIDRTGFFALSSGTYQVKVDATDGKLYAGGGTVTLDANGIILTTGAGVYNALNWYASGVRKAYIYYDTLETTLNLPGVASIDTRVEYGLIIGSPTTGGNLTHPGSGHLAMSGSIKQSTAVWARAYNSGAIAVTTATWTLVTLDSERNDTDTIHSTASNTGRLTATRDGLYLIVFNGNFASNSTGFRGVQVRLNAAGNAASGTAIAVKSVAAVNGDRTGLNLVTLYQLSATDYVESFVYQNSGGNLNLDSVANYSPEFQMVRIA